MLYTIAILEDCLTKTKVKFNKTGNMYQVCLYREEDGDFTHKEYETIDEAQIAFNIQCDCVLRSVYSYEQRKQMLLDF